MQIPLIKGDAVDNNTDYRDALPVNMYAVNKEILGAKGYMLNWYGLSSFSQGFGVDRGAIWVAAEGFEGHYRVSGSQLVRVDSEGVVTDLGGILGEGPVSMDYSFNNLAIVADGLLYYYNTADGLRRVTDLDVGNPIDVVWVDGYFFLTDGKDLYHSDITDEEEYLPLDFGNSQFSPDASRGLGRNEDNEVIVFGAFTTEYFVNTGSENFAFQRIQRKAQKIGILGTHAKSEMEGKWYCLSRRIESSPSFHILSLGSEQAISTRETDKILGEYTEIELESVTVDVMIRDNVKFVIFHLPNHTLMFNESIAETMGVGNAWTVLKSDVLGDKTYRGHNFVRDPRTSRWICGDKNDESIGIIDEAICTHYDNIAEWVLFTPFIKIEAVVALMEIETIPGIAPDNDATVAISASVNGRSYSREWWSLYGGNLDYGNRFYLRNPFGYVRDYIGIKMRGASRSRMAFANLNLEIV